MLGSEFGVSCVSRDEQLLAHVHREQGMLQEPRVASNRRQNGMLSSRGCWKVHTWCFSQSEDKDRKLSGAECSPESADYEHCAVCPSDKRSVSLTTTGFNHRSPLSGRLPHSSGDVSSIYASSELAMGSGTPALPPARTFGGTSGCALCSYPFVENELQVAVVVQHTAACSCRASVYVAENTVQLLSAVAVAQRCRQLLSAVAALRVVRCIIVDAHL